MNLEKQVSEFLEKVARHVDLGTRQKIAAGFLRFIDDVSERSHIPREAFEQAAFVERTDEEGNVRIETHIGKQPVGGRKLTSARIIRGTELKEKEEGAPVLFESDRAVYGD